MLPDKSTTQKEKWEASGVYFDNHYLWFSTNVKSSHTLLWSILDSLMGHWLVSYPRVIPKLEWNAVAENHHDSTQGMNLSHKWTSRVQDQEKSLIGVAECVSPLPKNRRGDAHDFFNTGQQQQQKSTDKTQNVYTPNHCQDTIVVSMIIFQSKVQL